MSNPPQPRRGEIWVVDFSPARGSEQAGRRPGLVLQNDFGNRNPRYPNTIVLAMSTRGKPVPVHVQITPNRQNGLRDITHVKCEQILTISKARLDGPKALGHISERQLQQVETAVKLSLGLR